MSNESNVKTIHIYTCVHHDHKDMNKFRVIHIETVGVADYCPVCDTSRWHAQEWQVDVEKESRRETHYDTPSGSQIGRHYVSYTVIPNTAKLIADRDRGEYGDWYEYPHPLEH